MWNNIQIGKFKVKYTALDIPEKNYPYCDKDGNVLKKVSGKFEKPTARSTIKHLS